MSKVQDAILLANLFQDGKSRQFRSSEWKYIHDTNNNSYNAGNITFRTNHIRNIWKSWYDAYIAIPISVSRDSGNFGGSELVAFKQSFLSFVYGIQVKMNGTTVCNDTDVQYINNLRLLVDKSVDWAEINGPDIGYAKDESASKESDVGNQVEASALTGTITVVAATNDIVGVGTAFTSELEVGDVIVTAGNQGLVVATIADDTNLTITSDDNTAEAGVTYSMSNKSRRNENYNEGFFKRASYLAGNVNYRTNSFKPPTAVDKINFIDAGPTPKENNSDFGSAAGALTYSRVIHLPLRYLHPFFKELNFPMVNDDLEIVIQTHNNSSQTNAVLQVPLGNTKAKSVIRATCRLYYRELEFQPADASAINEKLRSGMVKRVRYNVTDVYTRTDNNATNFSELVTSSAINPVRLWVQLYTEGEVASGVASNAPMIAPIRPRTSQLKINNVNLYDDRLETVQEHWDELKTQLCHVESNCSQINQIDHSNNYIGFNVFDIARYGSDKVNQDTSNELVLQITKANTPTDIIMLLEKAEIVDLQMSDGNLIAIIR